jgi:long-chain acyl-CoA synthetase
MTADTLPKLLIERARQTPMAVAVREKDFGIWHEMTWAEYVEQVKLFSLGLRALGLARGDKVAIVGDNHPEWYIAELAAQAAGAASVGLFQDAVPREVQYIVDHSDARFAVVEDQEQVDKLLEVRAALPNVEKIIYYDPKGLRHYDQPFLLGFPQVQELGRGYEREHPGAFEDAIAEGRGDDLALLCYTSGTTGSPKGAMLSHTSLLTAVRNLLAVDAIEPGDNYLSFLPCGWIVEQALGVAGSMVSGQIVNFPEEPETVQQNIREIGPRLMVAAPRIWENLISEVMVKMQDASWLKRQLYGWGIRTGSEVDRLRSARQAVPLGLRLQRAVAERLVFFPLRDQLGLRKLRRAYTGGAGLGPDTFRFFRSIGVNLKQVYGQTEIAGLSVIHRDAEVDPETVGKPITETELRISDEGEILSRSGGLFAGYYKNPTATADTLRDGWLYSGDAGLIDERGELIVLDRMKDVMVLADGRKFSPQYIENKLKFSPYIREAVALGQDRPYVAAMLNIDMANVGKWAETHGVGYTTYTDLAQKPEVYELIAQDVRRVNADLPAVARVRRFVLLHKELDADDEEVTRTRKVRRSVVTEHYAEIIEALHSAAENVQVDTEVRYQDGRRARMRANLQIYESDASDDTSAIAATRS